MNNPVHVQVRTVVSVLLVSDLFLVLGGLFMPKKATRKIQHVEERGPPQV